jgi:uncharacterized protein (DUF3820 family)
MITIIEWRRRQQFESKKLASEYFKIPVWLINKSIANGQEVSYRVDKANSPSHVRKYKFSQAYFQGGITKELPVQKTIPFGKYKGKEPKEVPLGYLLWMYKKTDCPLVVLKALREVKLLIEQK